MRGERGRAHGIGLLAAVLLLLAPSAATAGVSKAAAKLARERLSQVVSLGRQSGLPVVRARAVELCIRFDKKARKDCAKEGAADPAPEVRVAVARSLYAVGRARDARPVLKGLFMDRKITFAGTLEKVFSLPEKAQKAARKDLLAFMADEKIENRQSRVSEIGTHPTPFARSVLVEGALGRKEPPRSELRANISSLDLRMDVPVVSELYKRGDSEIRNIILASLDRLPSNAALPAFVTEARVKERKAGPLTRRLGLLLAKHGKREAEPYLLAALKVEVEDEAKIELLNVLGGVATGASAGAVRPFTDKEKNKLPVRLAAWAVLMRARDAKALKRIDRWQRTDDGYRRAAATRALAYTGSEKAHDALHGYLADGLVEVRKAAAEALAELANPESAEPLLRALQAQSDPEERRLLAAAVFRVLPADRLGDVSYLLQDRDLEIQAAAIEAMASARDVRLAPFLRPLLMHKDSAVRLRVLEGLMLSDPKEGMLAFTRGLNWLEGYELVSWARDHGELMGPFVKKALTSSRDGVRYGAIDSLEQLPPPTRVDVAAGWVESTTSPAVRIRLLEILAAASPAKVLPLLEKAAAAEDHLTRAAAVRLLGRLGKSTDVVIKALDDQALEVQMEAVAGLLGG